MCKESLSQHLKSKLGIDATEFARLEGVQRRTLYSRWNTKAGKIAVKDAVIRRCLEKVLA